MKLPQMQYGIEGSSFDIISRAVEVPLMSGEARMVVNDGHYFLTENLSPTGMTETIDFKTEIYRK